jgi:hypothetical protein
VVERIGRGEANTEIASAPGILDTARFHVRCGSTAHRQDRNSGSTLTLEPAL